MRVDSCNKLPNTVTKLPAAQCHGYDERSQTRGPPAYGGHGAPLWLVSLGWCPGWHAKGSWGWCLLS